MRLSFDASGAFDVSLFGHDRLFELCAALSRRLAGRRCIFVTTPTVYERYREGFFEPLRDSYEKLLVIKGGEQAKSPETALSIADACFEADLDRLGVIVGIGGGVCTDLVGLAASLVRRGIAHLRVPTTLVGQIDAAIGIKCAANFGGKKNSLGAFHAPERVFVCPGFLRSLPKRQIREGMSEILKIALVRDRPLFDLIELHGQQLVDSCFSTPPDAALETIERSISDMIEELSGNPFEKNSFQRKVDYGHCFSPLIEAASGYRTPHGEAVGVDIALSVCIAEELGLLHGTVRTRVFELFDNLGLSRQHHALTLDLCLHALETAAKHRGGSINFPLTTDIGEVLFVNNRDSLDSHVLRRSMDALDRSLRTSRNDELTAS
jgi:2-epi-5-epi-valiolone synthase